jgi:hypothetical protein
VQLGAVVPQRAGQQPRVLFEQTAAVEAKVAQGGNAPVDSGMEGERDA